MSQMHAHVAPMGGQPWLSSGSHGASLVPPVQPAVVQPSISSSSDSVSFLSLSLSLFHIYFIIRASSSKNSL